MYDPKYPRVLIVYHMCINKADQHGVSIRGWFADWPTANLAQVYSGGDNDTGSFCGRTFKLGARERRLGKLFFRLKESRLAKAGLPVTTFSKSDNQNEPWTLARTLTRMTGRFVFRTGLWEIIFRPVLSKPLMEWILAFEPEIIYCQGYTLGFTWLPLMLKKAFAIPICFQTGDDWPKSSYSQSALSFFMRPLVVSAARNLIRGSTVRLANGDAMARVYLDRYGVAFRPVMMCDDYGRFQTCVPRRVVESGRISVVYAGSLGSERWQPLMELCEAARELESDGFDVVVTALISAVPAEAIERLRGVANLQMVPAPPHEELPAYLRGADVLFLPESFDARQAGKIHLSISTKAHLYMMSERPALLYGHRSTGIMEYARQIGWGCWVDRHDRGCLRDALRKLLTDRQYCYDLERRGRDIALQRHDANCVCEEFRQMIASAV